MKFANKMSEFVNLSSLRKKLAKYMHAACKPYLTKKEKFVRILKKSCKTKHFFQNTSKKLARNQFLLERNLQVLHFFNFI